LAIQFRGFQGGVGVDYERLGAALDHDLGG
jgi:hypothetical protein